MRVPCPAAIITAAVLILFLGWVFSRVWDNVWFRADTVHRVHFREHLPFRIGNLSGTILLLLKISSNPHVDEFFMRPRPTILKPFMAEIIPLV
jgi:hypothetical protein